MHQNINAFVKWEAPLITMVLGRVLYVKRASARELSWTRLCRNLSGGGIHGDTSKLHRLSDTLSDSA